MKLTDPPAGMLIPREFEEGLALQRAACLAYAADEEPRVLMLYGLDP